MTKEPRVARYFFDPIDGLHVRIDSQKYPDAPIITLCPHVFSNNDVVTLNVPEEFRSDLASVPRLLHFLFDPLGRHQRAALFHDWLYSTQPVSRQLADALFRAIMELDNVSSWRRWLMYFGVRLFGGYAWRKRA